MEIHNMYSLPLFLMRVLREALLEDRSNHKLLVIAVHAVLLDSGFIQYNSVSGKRVDRFRFSGAWPKTSFTMSFTYTLPEILQNQTNGQNGIDCIALKFRNVGPCVSIYGSLTSGGSGPYSAHLNRKRFGPMIQLVNDRDGLIAEREVMSFWNVVKDEIVLPLSFDLCAKVGLPAPANFMQLPSMLQIKILELLPAEDIAKVGCVCKELRDLVDDEELWKQLVLDEFVHELFFP